MKKHLKALEFTRAVRKNRKALVGIQQNINNSEIECYPCDNGDNIIDFNNYKTDLSNNTTITKLNNNYKTDLSNNTSKIDLISNFSYNRDELNYNTHFPNTWANEYNEVGKYNLKSILDKVFTHYDVDFSNNYANETIEYYFYRQRCKRNLIEQALMEWAEDKAIKKTKYLYFLPMLKKFSLVSLSYACNYLKQILKNYYLNGKNGTGYKISNGDCQQFVEIFLSSAIISTKYVTDYNLYNYKLLEGFGLDIKRINYTEAFVLSSINYEINISLETIYKTIKGVSDNKRRKCF